MKKNINKIILILLILNAIVIYFAIIKTHEKSQTIKLGKENLVSEIDIDYSVKANPLSKVEVKDLSKTDAEINACVGNLGQSFDISGNFYNFQLQEATVTMKYDESKLNDTPEDRIGILWDDKENNKMVIVDTKVDTEKTTISFKTEPFSEYILVNIDEW